MTQWCKKSGQERERGGEIEKERERGGEIEKEGERGGEIEKEGERERESKSKVTHIIKWYPWMCGKNEENEKVKAHISIGTRVPRVTVSTVSCLCFVIAKSCPFQWTNIRCYFRRKMYDSECRETNSHFFQFELWITLFVCQLKDNVLTSCLN